MRLQVFLSNSGVASRRGAAVIIRSGKVSVNGRVVLEPAFQVCGGKDKVFFNSRRVVPRGRIYVMLNKPVGVTTTKKDPFARKTVMELLPDNLSHLNPVGRLDRDTRGLLLFSNDGEFINRLTHPSFNVEKTYTLRLDRRLAHRDKRALEKGIYLEGRTTASCSIAIKEKNRLEITIHEGRKRQIKKMFAKSGYRVTELKRLRQGHLGLGALPEGKWRFLTKKEMDDAVGRDIK